jgi:hypothetical protein
VAESRKRVAGAGYNASVRRRWKPEDRAIKIELDKLHEARADIVLDNAPGGGTPPTGPLRETLLRRESLPLGWRSVGALLHRALSFPSRSRAAGKTARDAREVGGAPL